MLWYCLLLRKIFLAYYPPSATERRRRRKVILDGLSFYISEWLMGNNPVEVEKGKERGEKEEREIVDPCYD